MYQQDWIMRQIQMLVQFAAKLVWKKETIEYKVYDEDELSDADVLYYELEKLLERLKICEAENLLYERMDRGDKRYLELALHFYQRLNAFSDEKLRRANFSREEIQSGLHDIMQLFGLPMFSL